MRIFEAVTSIIKPFGSRPLDEGIEVAATGPSALSGSAWSGRRPAQKRILCTRTYRKDHEHRLAPSRKPLAAIQSGMALGARAGRRRLPSSCDVGLATLRVPGIRSSVANRAAEPHCVHREEKNTQPTNPIGHLLAHPKVVMCAAAARQLTVAM